MGRQVILAALASLVWAIAAVAIERCDPQAPYDDERICLSACAESEVETFHAGFACICADGLRVYRRP